MVEERRVIPTGYKGDIGSYICVGVLSRPGLVYSLVHSCCGYGSREFPGIFLSRFESVPCWASLFPRASAERLSGGGDLEGLFGGILG